jgi:type IV secretory pathway VirB9-like protein
MEGELYHSGERYVFEPCLTEAEYQEAVARAYPVYEKAKAAREQEQAARAALYAAARARLPEIKAAYERAVKGNNP